MTIHRIERSQVIRRPREEVFAFFADAFNLEKITPAFLKFRILNEPPILMEPGTLIDYSLSLHGIPVRWRTRIEEFVPNERFVDVQLKGPYRLWHHTHTFEDHPEGTLVGDQVDYEMPFGILGTIARAIAVRRQLDQIFDYRVQSIDSLFPDKSAEVVPGEVSGA